MADFTRHEEVEEVRRTVYTLPARTNWVEVEKVLTALRSDLVGTRVFDDSVIVTADDGGIQFTITHSSTVRPA